jgi:uncharacterized DUF497 family protein
MFEWDDDNVDHIARHGVMSWEAEEAMLDRRKIRIDAHSGQFGIAGRTGDGRLLAVFFDRQGEYVRVATARDASPREERAY